MSTTAHRPVRVLIVDDQRMFADALAAQLELDDRVQVVGVASTPEEAAGVACEIDVALVDLVMPLLDGVELTLLLRRLHPGLRVILVSGRQEEHLEESAREAGAESYLRKGSLGAEVGDAVVAAAAAAAGPTRF